MADGEAKEDISVSHEVCIGRNTLCTIDLSLAGELLRSRSLIGSGTHELLFGVKLLRNSTKIACESTIRMAKSSNGWIM